MYEAVQIGRHIRVARNERNLTQSQLAQKTNIKQTQLSAYENGKNLPNITTLAIIAKALNKSIDELYYGDASISFITSAPDKGSIIANAIEALWEQGCIFTEEPMNYEPGDCEEIILRRFEEPICRLLEQLHQLEDKGATFDDQKAFLKMVKQSVAKEINKIY